MTLYEAPDCWKCVEVKAALDALGVPYEAVVVRGNPRARAALVAAQQRREIQAYATRVERVLAADWANAIIEDVDPNPNVVREIPVLDTLMYLQGGNLKNTPDPQTGLPLNQNATMTYYHGALTPPVVFSGFNIWSFNRNDIIQLVDFVMQQIWGLPRQNVARGPSIPSAARPSASTSTVLIPRGGTWRNNTAASASEGSTASIMRSCRSGSTVFSAAAASGLPAASDRRQATPRSMRFRRARPLFLRMSVAFDDHGEIVPGRGVTRTCTAPAAGASVGAP